MFATNLPVHLALLKLSQIVQVCFDGNFLWQLLHFVICEVYLLICHFREKLYLVCWLERLTLIPEGLVSISNRDLRTIHD